MQRWLALVLLVTLAVPARADEPADPDATHPGMAMFEAAVALAVPAAWYWSTKEHQAVDFELDGSWGSWRRKLFSTEKLLFDTNPFHVNAIRHPLAGVLDFQILRSNGFSPTSGVLFAALKGALWEYCFEYREDPSINDMIFNTAGAMAIGEPLYRIGQLWRGGRLTLADRLRTALVSPFDAFHDTYRPQRSYVRPSAWASIDLSVAGLMRGVERDVRPEIALAADVDVVSSRAFAEGGTYEDATHFGEWSRLRATASLGDRADRGPLARTEIHTATTLFGRYQQDGGVGELLAMGTGFTYRDDRLGGGADRLAIAHLIGPRLQLSSRGRDLTVIWDLAAYSDFALAQALVFDSARPFPPPPPYYSSLQAEGYIDAYGLTGASRLRAFAGPLRADIEGEVHLLRQIDGHDRITGEGEGAPPPPPEMMTARGIVEQRAFWRAELAYQPGMWGVALVIDGARRSSTWRDQRRTSTELSVGAAMTLAY